MGSMGAAPSFIRSFDMDARYLDIFEPLARTYLMAKRTVLA
jgi:hypothetical protein